MRLFAIPDNVLQGRPHILGKDHLRYLYIPDTLFYALYVVVFQDLMHEVIVFGNTQI